MILPYTYPSQIYTQKISLTSLEWPPYIGEKLPGKGYVSQFVKAALKIQGIELEIEFLPWMRAFKKAKSGPSDGLFPEYFSKENEKDFYYSVPFPGGPIGFYKRRDGPIVYKSLKKLKLKKIGVVRGYINTHDFDSARYLIKKHNPAMAASLEFMSPVLEERPLYIVFSKKSKKSIFI